MWLIQFHFPAIWKMKTTAQWTKILIRKQLYSSIFLRWLKIRSTWYCTHFRLILTLTLQTVCPRKFLCSQLAITCSIWARSKKSNCKGSGISWLKSIESRILKIFRRTRKKIKSSSVLLGTIRRRANHCTQLTRKGCAMFKQVQQQKTGLKSKFDFISNIPIYKNIFSIHSS